MSDFAFACCAPGMERALKSEAARVAPSWRLAFSRPGLCTFKAPTVDLERELIFARVWGRSLGRADDAAAAAALIEVAGVDRVHVFARDPEMVIEAVIPRATAEPAVDGERVADVIAAPGEPFVVGVHRAAPGRGPFPGGGFGVVVPSDAPSRAYAKIEEAIAWARLPVERGQLAVEIGAAPGGAALALARRGLDVWAVDPGDLAPDVIELPNVHHLQVKIGALRWEQLPARVDWLLVDVNLAPQVALHEVARIVPPMRASLRGAVFTLKLNELAFVEELPKLRERIVAMGLPDVRMRHLPSNRQEVCAVARPGL